MQGATWILRRILFSLPALIGAVAFTFVLTRALPGDPAVMMVTTPGAGPEDIARIRHQLGLDRTVAEQFWLYLRQIAQGNLGYSFTTGQPVLRDLALRLPASLELTLFAILLATATAVPLGVAAALRPGGIVDRACTALGAWGSCMPAFVKGLLLIYVFYYLLGWAPEPVGRLSPLIEPPPPVTGLLLVDSLLAGDGRTWLAALRQLLLPGVSMAMFAFAPLARVTRASMLEALSGDPVRTARALGLSRWTVTVRYGLRNALAPVLATFGMVFSALLGANAVVEKVFAWPGIGTYVLDALMASDYAPVQGFVLAVAAAFVAVNLLIDLACGWADPRVVQA